jgi:hypothetical protein
MSEDLYQAWAIRHGRLFGLSGDGTIDLILEWGELFRLSGYSAGELHEATTWLATNGQRGLFPADQMQAVRDRVRAHREDERPKAPPPEHERGNCTLCGSTGRVIVPDARCLTRWPDVIGGTTAVLCRCPLGLWFQSQNKRGQLALGEYEREVPHWRELMAQKDAFLAQRGKVESQRQRLNATGGRVRLHPAHPFEPVHEAGSLATSNGVDGRESS